MLVAPARITGLVATNGQPLAGRTVLLYRASEYGTSAGPAATATTGDDGRFVIEDVEAPQHYVIEVRTVQGGTVLGASAPFSLAASEDRTVDITVEEKLATTQTRRSAPDAPSVLVEEGSHTAAGDTATVRVHARNVTDSVQDFAVSLVGLEGAWLPQTVIAPAIPPDATVTIDMLVTPPVGSSAGDYPFLVVVEAATSPAGANSALTRSVTDASLRIDAASELVLTVEPADVRGVRRQRVDVVVANSGTMTTSVELGGTAEAALDLHLRTHRVEVGPAETVRVSAVLRAKRPRLVGGKQRHSFTVTATGRAAPQRAQGTFTARALMSSAMLRGTAIVVVVALWVVGAIIGLPKIASQFTDNSTTLAEPSAEPGAGGAEGSSGGAGGAEGGGDAAPDGADGGGDAAGGAASGDASVRVSGVVSGAEPDDVRIQVVPTSSLWSGTSTNDADGADASADGASDGAAGGGTLAALPVALGPTVTPVALAWSARGLLRLLPGVADLLPGILPARDVPRGTVAPGKVSGAAMAIEGTDSTSQRLTTTTNDKGVWALSGLSASARYLVTVSKPGFRTQRVVVTGAELRLGPRSRPTCSPATARSPAS